MLRQAQHDVPDEFLSNFIVLHTTNYLLDYTSLITVRSKQITLRPEAGRVAPPLAATGPRRIAGATGVVWSRASVAAQAALCGVWGVVHLHYGRQHSSYFFKRASTTSG
jgi:hypothetical protein